MNNLFKLNSLNALRSLRHVSHSQSASLRRLTTCSSLIRKHSIASSPHNLLIARNFRSDSRNNEITPPFNWGIQIVPESIAFVIERFGKYHAILHSGIHFLVPFIDEIAFAHSLKEEVFNVPNQSAVTQMKLLDDYMIHQQKNKNKNLSILMPLLDDNLKMSS
ncbi:hypothetical protein M0R45_038386 [Rubus argutus]|uniref:Band 7 domain-containing protein n=1 Tax=Rubus argutus TaxID=59490 RepID=A0AAW1W6I1_RUBAR